MRRVIALSLGCAFMALPASALAGGSVVNPPACPPGYSVNEMAYCAQNHGTKILWNYAHGQVLDQSSPGQPFVRITAFTPKGYYTGSQFHPYNTQSGPTWFDQLPLFERLDLVLVAGVLVALVVCSTYWLHQGRRRVR